MISNTCTGHFSRFLVLFLMLAGLSAQSMDCSNTTDENIQTFQNQMKLIIVRDVKNLEFMTQLMDLAALTGEDRQAVKTIITEWSTLSDMDFIEQGHNFSLVIDPISKGFMYFSPLSLIATLSDFKNQESMSESLKVKISDAILTLKEIAHNNPAKAKSSLMSLTSGSSDQSQDLDDEEFKKNISQLFPPEW